MSFESFYEKLISDQLWFELLRHYKDETIKAAARKVYAALVADNTVDIRPMSENRKHVYNILCKNPGDKPVKKWYDITKEEKKNEPEIEISEEEIKRRLQEWQDSLKDVQMVSAVPKLSAKQIIEEGNWRAVKLEHPKSEFERLMLIEEHKEKVNAARRKFYLQHKPNASEEEINAYVNKFNLT
jgi:hypothetical protein